MTVTLDDIRAAQVLLAPALLPTPLIEAPGLACGKIFLKLENLQVSGSFKARGALVRLTAMSAGGRALGVVAMSAGNHAQGVAWHARTLGIPVTIIMPEGTPFTKVERTESLGARVVLKGQSLAEAEEHALSMAAAGGLTFIHPYDDAAIIAGQGTVALEMLAARPDLDTLVIPVGGGGLIAGMAVAAKALNPAIRIIGVQAAGYATLVRGGNAQIAASVPTLAEGIAVKRPGKLTRPIIDALVDDVVIVEEEQIERAVALLFDSAKVVAEGAAAAPLAAVMADPQAFAGHKVGLVVSGGNIDARVMASILMRGLVRAGRLARLRIEISDAPGILAKVASLIGANGGNILEVYHQRLFQDVPVKYAELDAVVEATDTAHVQAMIDALRVAGYPTRQLGSVASGE